MSSSRNVMKWDSKVHEDILVAISDVLQLSRTDWEHIMRALHDMGYIFTEGALKMSTNAAGRTVWNDKARSDLLLSIYDIAPPTTQEWDAIIAQLQAKGYTYNASAAVQHLQKLKRKEGGDAASTPSTPTKPKGGTPKTKKTPASGRKRKNQEVHTAEQDDDEEPDVKKPKIEKQLANIEEYLKEEPTFDHGEA
ncbi:hypothetical protein F5X97DRAFT_344444 [Nemania serpens]|nr:hypothetical protein F5X97DRAFT_344444 [Nemania serpens]